MTNNDNGFQISLKGTSSIPSRLAQKASDVIVWDEVGGADIASDYNAVCAMLKERTSPVQEIMVAGINYIAALENPVNVIYKARGTGKAIKAMRERDKTVTPRPRKKAFSKNSKNQLRGI